MKQKLLDALKLKFVGVAESTLDRIATKKAVGLSADSDVAEVVAGISFNSIVDSEIDSRITEANRKSVENYEKKHGLKEGKPVKKEEKTDDIPSDVPEYVKILIKQNEELAEKVNGLVKGTSKKTNSIAVREKLIKDHNIPAAYLDNLSLEIEDETEIDATVEKVKSGYDNFIQSAVNSKTIILTPDVNVVKTGNEPKEVTIGSFLDEEFPKAK